MKKFFLIFLVFFSAKGLCFAVEPIFAGIIWDDDNNKIIEKISTIQGFKDISPEKTSSNGPSWLCSSQMGIAKALNLQTRERHDADVLIETQILNTADTNNPIRSIYFSRSKATDNLFILNVVFNNNVDDFVRICNNTIDTFLKKYGLPARIVRDTYQWIVSDIEIDFDNSSGTISYYHLTRINEHCRLNHKQKESMTKVNNIDYKKLF
jgi:hypothetical protein